MAIEALHLVEANVTVAHDDQFELYTEVFGQERNQRFRADPAECHSLHTDNFVRRRVRHNNKPTRLLVLWIIAYHYVVARIKVAPTHLTSYLCLSPLFKKLAWHGLVEFVDGAGLPADIYAGNALQAID